MAENIYLSQPDFVHVFNGGKTLATLFPRQAKKPGFHAYVVDNHALHAGDYSRVKSFASFLL